MKKLYESLNGLVFQDMIDLYRARVNLNQVYQAIEATNLQAKPAMLGLLDQADDVVLHLLRKGAKRAVRFGAQGGYKFRAIPAGLPELLMELAPLEVAKWVDPLAVNIVTAPVKRVANGRDQESKS
jgi:hypothetical protein